METVNLINRLNNQLVYLPREYRQAVINHKIKYYLFRTTVKRYNLNMETADLFFIQLLIAEYYAANKNPFNISKKFLKIINNIGVYTNE